MAWYREWFGQEYLELYAHRDVEEAERNIDFVEEKLGGERPRAILDLACGAGRHTEVLRRRGYRTLGVDLSLTLLAQRPHLPRVGGDMRCLPFIDDTFDWILNFFTSFGYFERERENFRVLEEMVRILVPGGRFLIDFLNLDYVLEHLEARETRRRNGHRVDIERWWDPSTYRINKRIRVEGDGRPPRTFLESVRGYSRDEVTIGLRWAGLEVTESYGDFNGEPFHRDSPRLILVGRRPR